MKGNLKKKLFELLKKIPEGKVVTYKQLSDYLGIKSPKKVSKVLRENADPEEYPCYKVVYRDGKLSDKYPHGGIDGQRKKLKKEEVRFSGDRVDLKRSLYLFVGTPK